MWKSLTPYMQAPAVLFGMCISSLAFQMWMIPCPCQWMYRLFYFLNDLAVPEQYHGAVDAIVQRMQLC